MLVEIQSLTIPYVRLAFLVVSIVEKLAVSHVHLLSYFSTFDSENADVG